ncbi:MAG: DNA translocase FtsK, partial [Alphaproteobacteria bacterium]
AIVARDRRATTSYIQSRINIGYKRAGRIIEKMEVEGVISAPNHAGKRDVLVGDHSGRGG